MGSRLLLWAALTALILDQASKWFVIDKLNVPERLQIDVFPPLLRFRYGENSGINFGLFDDGSASLPWILIAISLVLIAGVWIWVTRRRSPWPMQLAAGLLIGGALGNVIDRLRFGHVLDFLNMSCCGINNPYVFNLADVFIFAGALGLAFFDPGGGRPSKSKPTKGRKKPS